MSFDRACGVLLHPTSLPGGLGIGSLGCQARRFVDFLSEAGQSYWQVCPLGPTGYADSPYQCFSAFAGNPMLIDLEELVEWGLLESGDIADAPAFPVDSVDYGWVIQWKGGKLQRAFERFTTQTPTSIREEFQSFCIKNTDWLNDFALFMALKGTHNGASWTSWERELVQRKAGALDNARRDLAPAVARHCFDQFLFSKQWLAIKTYANERGIQIIGDMPIFVAHDSADVWSHPEMFFLDENGQPLFIAGVPPDYFSPTGQRWGNPLYRWKALAKSDYAWWVERFRAILHVVDVIRLDHFRGFEAYWEVPASEATAEKGRWVKGPGLPFFKACRKAIGSLPIIAEDLGVITPEVDALRHAMGYPGMKVLQFAFDSDALNAFLPHNFEKDCVAYTGTHDNDTTVGWFQTLPTDQCDHVRRYLWCDGSNISWDMIRLAYMSVANLAVVPLQDALSLGTSARMNFPGRPQGNWQWRYRSEFLTGNLAGRLKELAVLTNRIPGKKAAPGAAAS